MKKRVVQSSNKFCPSCGAALEHSDSYCTHCGYSFHARRNPGKNPKKKSWIIALILIALIYFGVRYFGGQTLFPTSITDALSTFWPN